MQEHIQKRFDSLIAEGDTIIRSIPWEGNERSLRYFVNSAEIPKVSSWLTSTANLLSIVSQPGSCYITEANRLMQHEGMKTGIPSAVVQKYLGLLKSAAEEWKQGLLRKIEYIICAETFDDFLDHAVDYHKANKICEASILASAVLEDTIKKIATKNDIQASGMTLEPLIDALAKKGVLTGVKAKRVKSFAAVRNHALHAEWDKIDIRDVGALIIGTRELIEEFM